MIVVSLLLILVAVALLALGLAAGSSSLLISSIVASLLAAVALVIGARQAAALRRRPIHPEPAVAQPDAAAPGRRGARRRDSDPGLSGHGVEAGVVRGDAPSDFSGSDPILADPPPPVQEADDLHASRPPGDALESQMAESAVDAGRPDALPASDDGTAHSDADDDDDDDFDDRLIDDTATKPMAGDARAAGPDADAAEWDAPVVGVGAEDSSAAGIPATPGASDSSGRPGDLPATFGTGDLDEDDPADEPPPQTVRPSDAVRVARMNDEVLVVDGRPRYHLGDCPHLEGRRSEPLPIHEAMELGFSPCGQCRPVDRLVAQAAHR